MIRRYYSQWQRIWDRQRLFDSLYGTWLAQKDDINKFQLDEKDKMFKNFIFRMSQYSSRSGIYPVLETRIIEPWHVVKVLGAAKRDKQKVLIEMLRPTQSKPKKGFENGKSITGLWKLLTLRQKGTS